MVDIHSAVHIYIYMSPFSDTDSLPVLVAIQAYLLVIPASEAHNTTQAINGDFHLDEMNENIKRKKEK